MISPAKHGGFHRRHGLAFEKAAIDGNVVKFTVNGEHVDWGRASVGERRTIRRCIDKRQTRNRNNASDEVWFLARHAISHETTVFPTDNVDFIIGDVVGALHRRNRLRNVRDVVHGLPSLRLARSQRESTSGTARWRRRPCAAAESRAEYAARTKCG